MHVLSLLRLRRLPLTWLSLGLLWTLGPTLEAKAEVSKEYQVKAVFLFNFAQFVTWPPAAFAAPDSPFCIGILGDDPFGSFLDETVNGEKVNGHPLVIQRYQDVEKVNNCQILFISPSESQQLGNIFAKLRGRNILTVGDKEGFVRGGGMIRFVMRDNKVHLRINPEAAKAEGLAISSQLLRLAEIVKMGEN